MTGARLVPSRARELTFEQKKLKREKAEKEFINE